MPNHIFVYSVLAACIGATACAESTDVAPPAPVTSEEVSVLTHALLLEGTLADFAGNQRDSLRDMYYDQLYDRFGYDRDQLQELRLRYTEHPGQWGTAMDSVTQRLEIMRNDYRQQLSAQH